MTTLSWSWTPADQQAWATARSRRRRWQTAALGALQLAEVVAWCARGSLPMGTVELLCLWLTWHWWKALRRSAIPIDQRTVPATLEILPDRVRYRYASLVSERGRCRLVDGVLTSDVAELVVPDRAVPPGVDLAALLAALPEVLPPSDVGGEQTFRFELTDRSVVDHAESWEPSSMSGAWFVAALVAATFAGAVGLLAPDPLGMALAWVTGGALGLLAIGSALERWVAPERWVRRRLVPRLHEASPLMFGEWEVGFGQDGFSWRNPRGSSAIGWEDVAGLQVGGPFVGVVFRWGTHVAIPAEVIDEETLQWIDAWWAAAQDAPEPATPSDPPDPSDLENPFAGPTG
ncbi:MAG: hypothetical protein H6735_00270 [Alphaproteobacteria bacterium]|nr:hypothetical protein [Alphaproteobacteria bacterium]